MKLISAALSDLKVTSNPDLVSTTPFDLLAGQDPLGDFRNLVEEAEGGCLCIDDAHLFSPNPRGKTANDSNKILEALLGELDSEDSSTTFILTGMKEDLLKMLSGYNPSFLTRFSKRLRFEFVDYNEAQLTKILVDMAKKRNFAFESSRQCGVAIARVLARRMHRGAGQKGFANGRECEAELDASIQRQQGRLVRLKLAAGSSGTELSPEAYKTLLRVDTIGERPKLEHSPYMAELNKMVGLARVKGRMASLMNLQLINFDKEMRGEKPLLVSLHRVFMGGAGTGKTTVAKLYGKMLKEFGLLSDGDFIACTPSDLKGAAVGESAEKTRAMLESAKGKVLLIDEAYVLDPKRSTGGGFGAEVLDVLVEKLDAGAGSDFALILAGYQPQMEEMFRNAGNEGLRRRLNLSEAFMFDDLSDADIRVVLKEQILSSGLAVEPATLDAAVMTISKKRMQDGFGNAGEAEQMLAQAKLKLSQRLSSSNLAASVAASASSPALALGPGLDAGISLALSPPGLLSPTMVVDSDQPSTPLTPSSASALADEVATAAEAALSASSNLAALEAAEQDVHHRLLREEDFSVEKLSSSAARAAFAGLEHMGHVDAVLDRLEALVSTAKEEGKKPHEVMADCHMLFLGPPGSGKTTCAKRFATMLKQLEVLPTDKFEYVTASNLIDRYIGGSGNNTLAALRRAKGGILFIDEAYGMLPGKSNWFGGEICQALLDNVTTEGMLPIPFSLSLPLLLALTPSLSLSPFPPLSALSPEFKGKIIIILGGYEEHIQKLFAVNPGFQSRFDKLRVSFPEWSAQQASEAVIKSIQKDGKQLTPEAEALLPQYFDILRRLPNWASARDAMELIRPALEAERAGRVFAQAKLDRIAATKDSSSSDPASAAVAAGGPSSARSAAAKKAAAPPLPYSKEDVEATFDAAIKARGGPGIPRPRPSRASPSRSPAAKIRRSGGDDHVSTATGTGQGQGQGLGAGVGLRLGPSGLQLGGIAWELCCDHPHPHPHPSAFEGEDDCRVEELPPAEVEVDQGKSKGKGKQDEENEDEEDDDDEPMFLNDDCSSAPPAPAPVKAAVKVATTPQAKPSGGGSDDEADDDEDFWAALEEAVGALGWPLQRLQAMLADVSTFPPREILDYIKGSTGCSDEGKIKECLRGQRVKQLAHVTAAIAAQVKTKTKAEEQLQEALQVMGLCPAGYEWIKEGDGYRCGGGSHYCANEEIQEYMSTI